MRVYMYDMRCFFDFAFFFFYFQANAGYQQMGWLREREKFLNTTPVEKWLAL